MSIYQHYRPEEHSFIDQVLNWKEIVERTFERRITDFLNPREQVIISQLIGETNEDFQLAFFGGGKYTERKIAIIAPFYDEITEDDFQLTLLEADYAEKFINISHPDVMGAFLSLGIERKKLGDIFVENGIIQLITTEDIAPYVLMNLTSVKNANINLATKLLSGLIEKKPNWKESNCTVSSLRVDAVLKEIYHMSRSEAVKYITRKNLRVNFKLVEDVKFELQAGDLISLRGRGRSKLVSINGHSRKNKLRITTAILK